MARLPAPSPIQCPQCGETRHIRFRELIVGLAPLSHDTFRRTEQPMLSEGVMFACLHTVDNIGVLIRATETDLRERYARALARERAEEQATRERRAEEERRLNAEQAERDAGEAAHSEEVRKQQAAAGAKVAAEGQRQWQAVHQAKVERMIARSQQRGI